MRRSPVLDVGWPGWSMRRSKLLPSLRECQYLTGIELTNVPCDCALYSHLFVKLEDQRGEANNSVS